MMPSLMLMVAIIAIFYFVGIRPQKKQADQQRKLQTGLKRGDKVFTNSGILGKVHQVEDNIVTLEIAKNTNIKILKSQINGLQPDASASE
jgi:preprotein translocase subunit YajC